MSLPSKRIVEALMREVKVDTSVIPEALSVYEMGVPEELIWGLAGPNAFFCAEELGKKLSGNQMLGAYFIALQYTKHAYARLGLSQDVFYDTITCFPRFIEETKRRTGVACFDRQWWTWRQSSMRLFRFGELEYEFNSPEEIALHIPSGCDLSKSAIEDSLAKARFHIRLYFREYENAKIVCTSWLLSPELKKMLPASSNILTFQSYFDIKPCTSPSNDIKAWVFEADEDTPIEKLKEETTLQRNLKSYLLNGGEFFDGFGILKLNY